MQTKLNLEGLEGIFSNASGLRFRYSFNAFKVSVAFYIEQEGLFEVAFLDKNDELIDHELLGGYVDRMGAKEVNEILEKVSWL